jgi:hypothetical protein
MKGDGLMDKRQESGKSGAFDWMPAALPKVAALMKDKRTEFGAAHVSECFRRGMAGEPDWFFAREGGVAVGTPFAADSVLAAWQTHAIKPGQALVLMRKPQVQHGAN